MYIPDSLDRYERHMRQQEAADRHLPLCAVCREPIRQEDAVKIVSSWYCDECLKNMREWIEDDE